MADTKYMNFVELDGRTLEGGGQLLRNSLCISALTGTPVKIDHIRGNRYSGGGLKAQHLACVKWLAHACNAKVEAAEKGGKTLLFEPGKNDETFHSEFSSALKKVTVEGESRYETRLDIGTAGATGLALQAVLPFILFSQVASTHKVCLTLTEGTNVSGSPSYEYIVHVLLPMLEVIGLPRIQPQLKRRGWSHGGSSIGEVSFEIPPSPSRVLQSFNLVDVNLEQRTRVPSHLKAIFLAPASCHDHFRRVLVPAVQYHFGDTFSTDHENSEIQCEDSKHEKLFYLLMVATVHPFVKPGHEVETYKLARDWLYDRKIRSHERAAAEMAERVANELASEVESGACVDEHMGDQLVIFQALANGKSTIHAGADDDGEPREPSLHTRTAEWVAKKMLGVRFDASNVCEGVAFGDYSAEETGIDANIQNLHIR